MEQEKKTISDITVSLKDLLETGAHFGHQKRRWNPKMKRYIFEDRNGVCIIDLSKTIVQIRSAIEVVEDVVASHKSILFVGTKKQAKVIVRDFAEQAGEFYVCERWLGGMLTNLKTIRQSVKTLENIEKKIECDQGSFTKKELTVLSKKRDILDKNLSGIRSMRKPPGLVIIVDPNKEHIAVAESRKLGIPVMALVDTNCDPDPIDHVIACNDDALKSVRLILGYMLSAILAVKEKRGIAIKKEDDAPKGAGAPVFDKDAVHQEEKKESKVQEESEKKRKDSETK